jgi:hypothetical protein
MGQSITVSGSLLDNSVGVPGRRVDVIYHVSGQEDIYHILYSNSSGGYSDTFKPGVAGNWTVRASFAGDEVYSGSNSAVQSFTVEWTRITFSVDPSNVAANRNNVIVSGSLLAGSVGVPGRTLTIEYLLLGQAPIMHSVITNATGGFSDVFVPNFAGNWSVRVSFAGDALYAGPISDVKFLIAVWA